MVLGGSSCSAVGCKSTGNVGWICSKWFELKQVGLVEDVPANARGLELDHLRGPFHPKPFYDYLPTIRWRFLLTWVLLLLRLLLPNCS